MKLAPRILKDCVQAPQGDTEPSELSQLAPANGANCPLVFASAT
jgi:hypothetical protein